MKPQLHEDLTRRLEAERFPDRSTGLVFAAFFAVVALLPLVHHRPLRLWALSMAAAFAILALLVPRALSPLTAVWFRLSLLLGAVMGRVTMALLFYAVFTPMGVVLRWLGKDLLQLKRSPDASSYWIDCRQDRAAATSMKNQF